MEENSTKTPTKEEVIKSATEILGVEPRKVEGSACLFATATGTVVLDTTSGWAVRDDMSLEAFESKHGSLKAFQSTTGILWWESEDHNRGFFSNNAEESYLGGEFDKSLMNVRQQKPLLREDLDWSWQIYCRVGKSKLLGTL